MSLEKVELRYVYDCENNKNVLQYRNITETSKEPWTVVPVLYNSHDLYEEEIEAIQRNKPTT